MIRGNAVWMLLVLVMLLVAANLTLDISNGDVTGVARRFALAPEAEKAVEYTIERFDGATTNRVVLVKGTTWSVAQPFEARADERVLLRLSDALAFTPIAEEMDDDELLRLGRVRADFGLENPGTTVQMKDAKGASAKVVFGSPTPAGDGVYAAVDGMNTVFIVPSNVCAAVMMDANDFRYRKVFDVDRKSVTSIDIRRGKGDFIRFVCEDGTWRMSLPHDTMASSDRIGRFLDAVESCSAVDFVWPVAGTTNASPVAAASLLAGYGLDPDSAVTVLLKCEDKRECSVLLGSESSKGFVYARLSDGRTIVTVPEQISGMIVSGMTAFMGSCLFPVDAKSVNMMSVDDGGVQYLLSRNAKDVDAWRLDAPVSAAADAKGVAKMIDRILALTPSDLDDDGVKVSIGTNSEPVVVSRKALLDDMRFEDLCSREMLRIPSSDIRRIAIADPDGAQPIVITADNENYGKIVAAFDPLKAEKVVRLKVSDSDLSAYGLDKPQMTLSIDRTDTNAMRRNLMIGDVADGGRYATLGANEAVFIISTEVANLLLGEAERKQ